MRESKVPLMKRRIMWAGVRWGALGTKSGRRRHWWKDAPAVLLWSLVALPIVAPPAVVILVALAVSWIFDIILWVLLWIGRWVKTLLGSTPTKELNRPTFEYKST